MDSGLQPLNHEKKLFWEEGQLAGEKSPLSILGSTNPSREAAAAIGYVWQEPNEFRSLFLTPHLLLPLLPFSTKYSSSGILRTALAS